jgi:hypothetical protein
MLLLKNKIIAGIIITALVCNYIFERILSSISLVTESTLFFWDAEDMASKLLFLRL